MKQLNPMIVLSLVILATSCGRRSNYDERGSECLDASDCESNERCQSGSCAPTGGHVSGEGDSDAGQQTQGCTDDSECGFGQICVNGTCGDAGGDFDLGTGAGGDSAEGDSDGQSTGDLDVSFDPGPGNESIECLTNETCGEGNVCCTDWDNYYSGCASEDECTGGDPEARGRIDACLTDEQCEARDGNKPICCHDAGDRNYCAPVIETCSPVEPCESFEDCVGASGGGCCTPHDYYQYSVCTPAFFSTSPNQCPPENP